MLKRLPYVICYIMNENNTDQICFVKETKSGLYGLPKEHIWEDELSDYDCNPLSSIEAKAVKILSDILINRDFKISKIDTQNQQEYVATIVVDESIIKHSCCLWINLTNKGVNFQDDSIFNSSFYKANKIRTQKQQY